MNNQLKIYVHLLANKNCAMVLNVYLFLSGTDFLVIFLIAVLLFGGTKIPQLMRGLGEGIKEFKKATKDDVNETHPEKPVSNNK